ncbi:unknown [Prevotella sp. CAG:891]|nr:unknown [Prevotella sp. CAG:891]
MPKCLVNGVGFVLQFVLNEGHVAAYRIGVDLVSPHGSHQEGAEQLCFVLFLLCLLHHGIYVFDNRLGQIILHGLFGLFPQAVVCLG